jgi:hypothetical protein
MLTFRNIGLVYVRMRITSFEVTSGAHAAAIAGGEAKW